MKTEEGNGNPWVALPSVVLGAGAGGGASLSGTAGGEFLELGPSLLEKRGGDGMKKERKEGRQGGGAREELWASAQTESRPWSSSPAQEARGPVLEYEQERDPVQHAFFNPGRMTDGPALDLCPAERLAPVSSSHPDRQLHFRS